MARSTSLAWRRSDPEAEPLRSDPHRLDALASFYRWQAGLYDWTRPLILFGRDRVVEGLEVSAEQRVLDVGCGTGWSLSRLAARGAEVVGIEPAPAMRARAERRAAGLARRPGASRVSVDSRPYGSHEDYRGAADRVLFSYSLSMMPHYRDVLEASRADLAPGGRIGVVDFLAARNAPTRRWLERCHVELGAQRLAALMELFPRHTVLVRRATLWQYFVFWGEAR
jgi:S-adenosylmethionine-diacylgycerolhomoserine-N-methlytransferase